MCFAAAGSTSIFCEDDGSAGGTGHGYDILVISSFSIWCFYLDVDLDYGRLRAAFLDSAAVESLWAMDDDLL